MSKIDDLLDLMNYRDKCYYSPGLGKMRYELRKMEKPTFKYTDDNEEIFNSEAMKNIRGHIVDKIQFTARDVEGHLPWPK